MPHPLTGHVDLAADFSQRLGLSTFKAKAQFEDLLLPLVELGDPGAEMFLLNAPIHAFHGVVAGRIWDQFTQGAAIFLAAGVGIERCTGGALAQQFFQFIGLHAHGMGQFQAIGLTPKAVGELPCDAAHLGEFFADMNRQANGAGAVINGARHALANPPVGVSRKFVAHGRVELVDRALKANGTFLHQVE